MKAFKYFLPFYIIGAIFINACKDDEVSLSNGNIKTTKDLQNKIDNIDIDSYKGLEDIFLNTKEIKSNGRPILLVFGQSGCFYCEKLKQDLKNNESLKNYIKDNFSAYYINISYSKNHDVEFLHQEINTEKLASHFNVSSTPLIFLAQNNGDGIIKVPGYPGMQTFTNMLHFAKDFDTNEKYKNLKTLQERMSAFNEINKANK